eukprot:gnl/Trimastix_PCT/3642.p1 GENE.gnl/Trimastix_PCT/3642~~gnl/Trimastix_PCT/3642.p1  ORF type:complete len:217 (+),score=34.78 gnl/Trimastix_PCT/3642:195-845(+)
MKIVPLVLFCLVLGTLCERTTIKKTTAPINYRSRYFDFTDSSNSFLKLFEQKNQLRDSVSKKYGMSEDTWKSKESKVVRVGVRDVDAIEGLYRAPDPKPDTTLLLRGKVENTQENYIEAANYRDDSGRSYREFDEGMAELTMTEDKNSAELFTKRAQGMQINEPTAPTRMYHHIGLGGTKPQATTEGRPKWRPSLPPRVDFFSSFAFDPEAEAKSP